VTPAGVITWPGGRLTFKYDDYAFTCTLDIPARGLNGYPVRVPRGMFPADAGAYVGGFILKSVT
jgi:hypothetical protein